MRILTVCEYWDPEDLGGSGRVSQETSLEWIAAGHRVTSIAAGPGDFDVDSWRGIERVQFPFYPRSGLLRAWRGFRRGWRHAWRDGPPDLVVVHQPMVMLWARSIDPWFMKRTRCVNFFHSPWGEEYLLARGESPTARLVARSRAWLERRSLARATDVFTLSKFMQERLLANHPSITARLHIAPGGVSLDAFPFTPDPDAGRPALGLPQGELILMTVRRLIARVGVDNLLRALAGAPPPLSEVRLVIGGRGPLRDDLERLAAELGLGDRVEFRGLVPTEELPRLIGAADLFVMPTRALEGFGLTTVEAMACGTPVAATPIGANPEVVEPLDPALVLPGADVEGIREGLLRLVGDRQRLKELRRRSRHLVESRYTWDRMAAAIVACASPGPTRSITEPPCS